MSEQTMTYADAENYLIDNVYAPVFFEKLAEYGIRPTSTEEARDLLGLAGRIESVEQAYQVKQAQDRTNFIGSAAQSLDNLLGNLGWNNASQSAEIKEAASKLAQYQDVRNAALLYQDSLRQLAAQQ